MNHHSDSIKSEDLVLIGICSDENSSFMRGAAKAPQLIRSALYSDSSNLSTETGVDLSEYPVKDLGDKDIGPGDEAFMDIERQIKKIVKKGAIPLTLGGDHAITYPIMRAMADRYGPLDILHFDAHPDLYHGLNGNRLSHACPFARIMEEGLARRLVQVGIRTLNTHQREQAHRFGVEVHEMMTFDLASFDPSFSSPLYISFDMDALDPAFAPGVSHFEPGGLSVREVLQILHKLKGKIVGADIVEYNPKHDHHNMTAMVAAKLIKEIGGRILSQGAAKKKHAK
jgi:agmatinase